MGIEKTWESGECFKASCIRIMYGVMVGCWILSSVLYSLA